MVTEGQAQPMCKWQFKHQAYTIPPVKGGGRNIAIQSVVEGVYMLPVSLVLRTTQLEIDIKDRSSVQQNTFAKRVYDIARGASTSRKAGGPTRFYGIYTIMFAYICDQRPQFLGHILVIPHSNFFLQTVCWHNFF